MQKVVDAAELVRLRQISLMQIPIEENQAEQAVPDLMPALRALSLQDRDVLEKGIKAFVSYVRGYKEHHCKYIFRIQDLNLAKLAYACALLQLPRMPEIRKTSGKIEGFTPADVNPNDIKVFFSRPFVIFCKIIFDEAQLCEHHI